MNEDNNQIGNPIVKQLLSEPSGYSYYSITLKKLIDNYYNFYKNTFALIDDYRTKMCGNNDIGSEYCFKDLSIENVKVDEKGVYKFDFVSNYPMHYRIPFTFYKGVDNVEFYSEEIDNKETRYFVSLIKIAMKGPDSELYSKLFTILKNLVFINTRHVINLGNLPYVIHFDFNQIGISDALDESNNIVNLVDINIDDFTIEFKLDNQSNDFNAMLKDYFLLLLEKVSFKRSDINNSLTDGSSTNYSFINDLLVKYELMDKPKEEKQVIEDYIPDDENLYYLNVPNEGFRLITGYRRADYDDHRKVYIFEFKDYSEMRVPRDSILKMKNGYHSSIRSCEAMTLFKKLTLSSNKDKE